MIFLDKNISYIIVSAKQHNLSKDENDKRNYYLEDSLYLLDYNIQKIGGSSNGILEHSTIAQNETKENDLLRRDCIWLLEKYSQEYAIIKYRGETVAKKIFIDGRETPLKVVEYTAENHMSYFYNGLSFSFCETKNYNFVSTKNQLRNGMVVEYFNGKEWKEKLIENIELEWTNSYNLLTKYKKLRYSNNI